VVSGWPIILDNPTDGAPAFGDIDGDGIGEVVVTTHEKATFATGTLYAFEGDGSNADGFPVTTDGGAIRTPVLADMDGDNSYEIVLAIRKWPEGFIYVFQGNGSVLPNWPQRMDYIPASAVAVGDINGDEIPEIVAESYNTLHAYTTSGVQLPGFPYFPGLNRVFSYSSPVLADLDGDGNREIICGDHSIDDGSGAVHIVDYNGLPRDGWPMLTESWVYGPPSVGDIDGDGMLDIAVGDQALSATPVNKVYAWRATDGTELNGFPITGIYGVNSQILLADLDGDNQIELIFDDNTAEGKYPGYNHDGTLMENWPLLVEGSTFFFNPMVADINLDNSLAISGGGYLQDNNETNFYLWDGGVEFNSALAILPVLQYNTRHNGVYGDTLMVGISPSASAHEVQWRVFPNPTTGRIKLMSDFSGRKNETYISVYNASGMFLFSRVSKLTDNSYTLHLESYPAGTYWIKISNADQGSKTFKVLLLTNRN
jgi:hypothetical protein